MTLYRILKRGAGDYRLPLLRDASTRSALLSLMAGIVPLMQIRPGVDTFSLPARIYDTPVPCAPTFMRLIELVACAEPQHQYRKDR